MRRASAIEKDAAEITTVKDLTGVFESLASTQVAKVKNKVELSKEFFQLLWQRYSSIRVDPGTRITNRASAMAVTRQVFIIISAEAGLSGDIDQRLVETMLQDYDPDDHRHHRARAATAPPSSPSAVFPMSASSRYRKPTATSTSVPVIEAVMPYSRIIVYYEEYVSLGAAEHQDNRLDLQHARHERRRPTKTVMTAADTIFEPSLDDIADQMEQTMMTLALSQTILESSLAQAASRFNAMAVAKKRANELLGDYMLEFHRAKRSESDRRLREVMVSIKKKRRPQEAA